MVDTAVARIFKVAKQDIGIKLEFRSGGRTDFNEIHENKVRNTGRDGIRISSRVGGSTSNNLVTYNVINNTGDDGIDVRAVSGTTLSNYIEHNWIKDTGSTNGDGILLRAVQPAVGFESIVAENLVSNNHIENADENGINVIAELNASVNENQVVHNNILNSMGQAVRLTDTNGTIEHNVITYNLLIIHK